MRKVILAALLALTVAACGSYNGGSSPAGGAATPVTTPQATDASKTPAPSGNPDVDNYGY